MQKTAKEGEGEPMFRCTRAVPRHRIRVAQYCRLQPLSIAEVAYESFDYNIICYRIFAMYGS